jgi:Na+/proline symporter
MIGDTKELKWGALTSALAYLLTMLLVAGVGLSALTLSIQGDFPALDTPDQALIRDIPRSLNIPVRNELLWSRVVVAVLLILSLLLSLYLDTLVVLLGVFGWGTFAAAIFPSVVLGLVWSGATKHGAIWSIITSIVLNFALEIGASNDIVVLPEGVVNGAFTLAIAIIVFIGVSLATKTEETSPEVKRVFEG